MSKQTTSPVHQQKQSVTPQVSGILQRQCACGNHTVAGNECEECGKQSLILQRASLSPHEREKEGQEAPPIVHEVLRSPGQPLDAATRSFFEPRFGYDFSQVRVHTDSKAAESAKTLNALAYTIGSDIAFGGGQYLPQTTTGKRLLAHELTHVLQQAPAHGAIQSKLLADNINNSYEKEANQVADVAVRVPAYSIVKKNINQPKNRKNDDIIEPSHAFPIELAHVVQQGPVSPLLLQQNSIIGQTPVQLPILHPLNRVSERLAPVIQRKENKETNTNIHVKKDSNTKQKPKNEFIVGILKLAKEIVELGSPLRARILGPISLLYDSMVIGFLERLAEKGEAELWNVLTNAAKAITSLDYVFGYIKGFLKGFFIDGLFGIFVLIFDIAKLGWELAKIIPAQGEKFVDAADKLKVSEWILSSGDALWKEFSSNLDKSGIAGIASDVADFIMVMFNMAKGLAKTVGEAAAEGLIKFFKQATEKLGAELGKIVGNIVGQATYEIIADVLTVGVGVAITAAKTSVRPVLSLLAKAGKKGMAVLREIGSKIVEIVELVKGFVNALGKTKFFKTLGKKFDELSNNVRKLIEYITKPKKTLKSKIGSTAEAEEYVKLPVKPKKGSPAEAEEYVKLPVKPQKPKKGSPAEAEEMSKLPAINLQVRLKEIYFEAADKILPYGKLRKLTDEYNQVLKILYSKEVSSLDRLHAHHIIEKRHFEKFQNFFKKIGWSSEDMMPALAVFEEYHTRAAYKLLGRSKDEGPTSLTWELIKEIPIEEVNSIVDLLRRYEGYYKKSGIWDKVKPFFDQLAQICPFRKSALEDIIDRASRIGLGP